jgi:hypothetical protein
MHQHTEVRKGGTAATSLSTTEPPSNLSRENTSIINITGKSPDPYPLNAFLMAVDRKLKKTIPYQKNKKHIRLLKHLPQQSPHTRVCGMRKVINKTNNT